MFARSLRSFPVVLAVASVVVASGCSGGGSGTAASSPPSSAASSSMSDPSLKMADAWVKAVPAADRMTSVFGELENTSDKPIVVASVKTSASDMAEIHEMAMVDGAMKMRRKEGGLPVPAGGKAELKPGGNHLMVMQLKKDVKAGDVVKVTVTTDDGTSLQFDATAKPFEGAEESYQSSTTSATK